MIKNSAYSILICFITFIAVTGCDDIISADVDEEFFIGPGQQAEIQESDMTITFNRVIEDSRCPIGVECVWAGNGKVEITVHFSGGKSRAQEINTNLEPKEIKAGKYRIHLLDLQPYPVNNQELQPENYRIKLIVAK